MVLGPMGALEGRAIEGYVFFTDECSRCPILRFHIRFLFICAQQIVSLRFEFSFFLLVGKRSVHVGLTAARLKDKGARHGGTGNGYIVQSQKWVDLFWRRRFFLHVRGYVLFEGKHGF